MIKAPLLFAVKRIIAGIEIEDHLLSILGQAAHSQQKQSGFDLFGIGVNFVTAGVLVVAQFEPVEGRGTGQGFALVLFRAIHAQRIGLADGDGKERIGPQPLVIVEILVTGGQAQEALGQQFAHGMFGKARVAMIAEAGGEGAGDAQAFVDLTQEEQTAIAAEVSAREVGLDAARAEIIEKKGLRRRIRRRWKRRGLHGASL